MSRGRRGDKTYTGPNGVPTDRLRADDKLRHTPAGQHGRVAPPSEEAMLAFIVAQRCPWCDAGPFKTLAMHTRKAHGVDRHELREMAGLTKWVSICSEELSAKHAARLAGQPLPPHAYGEGQRKPRTFSKAGRAVQREKARKMPLEQRLKAARASGDKQLAANAEKHARILHLFREGRPMTEIAETVGVAPETVRRTLRRAGINQDGRTRRWRNDESRPQPEG